MKYLLLILIIFLPIFVCSQTFSSSLVNHSFDNIFNIDKGQVKKILLTDNYIPSDTENICFQHFNITERIKADSILFFSKFNVEKSYVCYNDNQKVSLIIFVLNNSNNEIIDSLYKTLGDPKQILPSVLDPNYGNSYFCESATYNLQFLSRFFLGKNIILLNNKKSNEYFKQINPL